MTEHELINYGVSVGWISPEKAEQLKKEFPEIVRCKDCEYSYTEGFVHEMLLCEKHPELGDLSEDWFCADFWKA